MELIMVTAAKALAILNDNQFADAIRTSALQILETAQDRFDKVQKEGRITLSKQVLNGANRAEQLSKALTALSIKIAPAQKSKPRAKAAVKAKPKAAAKAPAVKTATKARAKKATEKAVVAG
jgi:hypothetical protein